MPTQPAPDPPSPLRLHAVKQIWLDARARFNRRRRVYVAVLILVLACMSVADHLGLLWPRHDGSRLMPISAQMAAKQQ